MSIADFITAQNLTADQQSAVVKTFTELGYEFSLIYPAATGGYDPAHPDALRVEGKYIMRGMDRFALRGVSLASVNSPTATGGWASTQSILSTFVADADMNPANVVRLPINSAHYNLTTPQDFVDNVLDPHVQTVINSGRYAIVDWHPIEDWDRDSIYERAFTFWTLAAEKYKDNPKVIFEFFNEPVNPNGGTLENWMAFKKKYQPLINMIRSHAPHNIIIIGSPNWTTRIKCAADCPFDGTNLVYSYHIYPNNGMEFGASLEIYLNQDIPENLPVMFTEFGYSIGTAEMTELGKNPHYKDQIESYFRDRPHTSWTAWNYDTASIPAMLSANGASMRTWVNGLLATAVDFDYAPPVISAVTDMPDLTALWRGDTEVTSLAGKVSIVGDQIASYDWVQNTAVDQPTIGTENIDGIPTINWSGGFSGQFMTVQNASDILKGANALSILVVARGLDTQTGDRRFIYLTGAGTIQFFRKGGGTIGATIQLPNGATKYLLGDATAPETFAALLTVDTVTGVATIRYSGQPIKTVSGLGTSNFGATGASAFIGALSNGDGNLNGGIAQMAMFSRVLSANEQAWLEAEFGL